MKPSQIVELVTLAALWGGSFLFMRMGAPDFGPVALIELRTAIAALFLLPIIMLLRQFNEIRQNAGLLLIVGFVGTAVPFCLLTYATLYVSAGYASILNATAPIFTAIVAWLWIKDRLENLALLGMGFGFLGVAVMVLDDEVNSSSLRLIPVLAGLGATLCYGIGANFTKQKLGHLKPLTIAGGSQLGAALCLLPFAIFLWPEHNPDIKAWVAVSILGIACTGIAFILFFRLIANVGVHKTISVTYLIPVFGVIWGMMILDEPVTLLMLLGGILILGGVTLTTGIYQSFNKRKTL